MPLPAGMALGFCWAWLVFPSGVSSTQFPRLCGQNAFAFVWWVLCCKVIWALSHLCSVFQSLPDLMTCTCTGFLKSLPTLSFSTGLWSPAPHMQWFSSTLDRLTSEQFKKKILLQTGKVILSLLKSVWNSVSGPGVTSPCAWGCRRWRKDKEIGKDTSRLVEGWFQVLGKFPWLPAPGNLARDVRAGTCNPGQERAWRLGQLSH